MIVSLGRPCVLGTTSDDHCDAHPGGSDMKTSATNARWAWGLAAGLTLATAGDALAMGHHKCKHRAPVASCGGCALPVEDEFGPCSAPQVETTYATVTETVYEQVPTTQMQTRHRTEFRTEQVPVTRTVAEQVPTTRMQTKYRTEYRAETYTTYRPVTETVQVPRTVTDWKPVTTTVNQPRYSTVMKPVTTTTLVSQPYTVNMPVTTTRLVTETVEAPVASGQSASDQSGVQASPQGVGPRTVTREVTETHEVATTAYRQVPVQNTRMVPEPRAEMVPTPVTRMVPEPATRQVPVTVPEQVPVTVMTTQFRTVQETTTRQVPFTVTEQVPVTVMTTVPRQVTCQVPVTRTLMGPASPAGYAPAPAFSGPAASPQD